MTSAGYSLLEWKWPMLVKDYSSNKAMGVIRSLVLQLYQIFICHWIFIHRYIQKFFAVYEEVLQIRGRHYISVNYSSAQLWNTRFFGRIPSTGLKRNGIHLRASGCLRVKQARFPFEEYFVQKFYFFLCFIK